MRPPATMRDALSDAIRNIVLPRLVAARQAQGHAALSFGKQVTAHDVSAFLSHVMTSDHSLASAMLTVLTLRGVSREDVLLELFQPVARRLGDMWLNDDCSFADVTLAVGRLQRLMRSEAMPTARAAADAPSGRVLIACIPGEQHTFGAAIVEDFFLSAGWETVLWSGSDRATLEVVAHSAAFDVVGISIGDPGNLPALKPLAAALRAGVAPRVIGVLAGGHAVAATTNAAAFGVDAIVHDARAALPTAQTLLGRRQG
jgi:MerR family transcriptional regulator, light-induced transcriptional regulator